jgi:hypothetical protein
MRDSGTDPMGARPGGAPRRPQKGLFVLAVERQADYLLITVTSTLGLEDGPPPAGDERTERFTDPADALRSAAQFLAAFG